MAKKLLKRPQRHKLVAEDWKELLSNVKYQDSLTRYFQLLINADQRRKLANAPKAGA
jgi:hypothetical protein